MTSLQPFFKGDLSNPYYQIPISRFFDRYLCYIQDLQHLFKRIGGMFRCPFSKAVEVLTLQDFEIHRNNVFENVPGFS